MGWPSTQVDQLSIILFEQRRANTPFQYSAQIGNITGYNYFNNMWSIHNPNVTSISVVANHLINRLHTAMTEAGHGGMIVVDEHSAMRSLHV